MVCVGLLDEVVVIDDGSTDTTAMLARHAGAKVHTNLGGTGKGQALRSALEQVELDGGYGIEIGLLIDIYARFGRAA